VNAMNTVLPVFEMERNMYYRHKAAMMYGEECRMVVLWAWKSLFPQCLTQISTDYNAINLSFLLCEVPFIVLASFVFTILWCVFSIVQHRRCILSFSHISTQVFHCGILS